MEEFLDKEFEKAVDLKKRFKKTEDNEWNSMTILNELGVQIGHYAYVLNEYKEFSKEHRKNY